MRGPKDNQSKLSGIISAWETLRPTKKFGGYSLAQFKAKVQPCFTTRTQIETLNNQLAAATAERDDADNAANDAIKLVVNSVRGDPDEGDNGELYKAMGYTRANERQTGLHRGNGGAMKAAAAAGK